MNTYELVKLSLTARNNAYAPYSGFRVGAALETEDGKIYCGANIENASYGATCCAERTAVFKAVSDGKRLIKRIAISSDSKDITFPCGICRQVLVEFGSKNTIIICANREGEYMEYKLEDLFPNPFGANAVENR